MNTWGNTVPYILLCILFINVCLEMFMIIACLPLEFTQEQYDTEDRKLVVALSVTLGLFAVELAGFFSGVSMFNSSQGLLTTGAHARASVACDIYWWIFAGYVLSAFLLFIAVFGLKKKPL
uniref:Transmembrane protein 107 n=1 Tax=Oryzias melastigma TaxID=30732 RepID=A0A3B3D773_ORYME